MRYIFAIVTFIMIASNVFAAQLKDTTITGNGTITGNLKVTGMATMTNLSVGTGIVSTVGNETTVTYNTSSTFVVPAGVTSMKVLVVGGGAGGDGGVTSTVYGHGGGGGRVTYRSAFSVTAGSSHTVTIGTGGTLGTIDNQASDGVQSAFSTITAAGGTKANNIGSGGDGGDSGNDIDTVVTNYNGLTDSVWGGAGGAGAGGVGGTVSDAAGGTGGAGYSSDIAGSSVAYGTGGDGSGTGSGVPSTVVANRGLGGHGHPTSSRSGGSGVVIVRFTTTYTSLNVIGKVGIGTSTPAAELHVLGTVTATSFSGNGAQLTGKENTLSNSAGLAAAISDETGTNTVVFNSSPTLSGNINLPGNGIWNSSGNVGIGATTVTEKLTIGDGVTAGGVVARLNATAANWVGTGLNKAGTEKWFVGMGDTSTYGDKFLIRRTSSSDDIVIDTAGSIGIGTTTPQTKLSVVGTVTATGFIGDGSQLTGISSGATWSGLTGVPTANAYVSKDSGADKIPFTGSSSTLAINWIDTTIVPIPGTTTAITGTSSNGRLYNLIEKSSPTLYLPGTQTYLLHMDGVGSSTTFVDSGPNQRTVTAAGNAVISTQRSVFGGSSGYFAAANDNVYILDNDDQDFGAGDFTIGGRAYHTSFSTAADLIQKNADSPNLGWLVEWGATGINFYYSTTGTDQTSKFFTYSIPINSWYAWEFNRKNGQLYAFINGNQLGASQSFTDTLFNSTNNLKIGSGVSWPTRGWIDEVYIVKGIALHDGTYTVNSSAYSIVGDYLKYKLQYIPPGTTTPSLLITDDGTNTGNTYMLADVTTAIFGLGTTTAITGTTTAYTGWFDGAVRATAFNVASTEKIKENIKPIKIKPDLLEAEDMAKQNYIAGAKVAWMAANQASYTTVVNEPGTGSVIYVDKVAMESAYTNYIELAWTSDINKNTHIENVQKIHEKGFWQMFDSVTPKSWNPKDKPSLTRKGFVVEDMPDIVKGDDKQSIDIGALIAYMSLVQQALKADTIFALSTLKELITTGTVTQQKIDYTNDRLEVLNP